MELKVSVITVVFNGKDTIEQTILSVLNQTYRNIEYIVVDGGSTDGTINILKKYSRKLFFISEKDDGIYDAMNKGIGLAHGDIIGIINSDDWYERDAIESIVNKFKENEKLDIICGDILLHRKLKGNLYTKICSSDPSYEAMRKTMSIYHPTVFVKKEYYMKNGMFDSYFKIAADYDFLLRSIKLKAKILYIPKVLAHFRTGGVSSGWTFSGVIKGAEVRRKNHVEKHYQLIYFIIEFLKCSFVAVFPKPLIDLYRIKK